MKYPTRCEHVLSFVYSALITAVIVGLWKALENDMAITWISIGLALYIAVYVIIVDWRLGFNWAIDLTQFRWQAAPIVAASLITGWTAQLANMGNEETAIAISVSSIYALFSIVVLSESLLPDLPRDHKEFRTNAKRKTFLFIQLFFIQGIFAFILGMGISAFAHSPYPALLASKVW